MARPYDRPATIVALVNAVVVEVLPVAVMWLLVTFSPSHSAGTTVVGQLPPGEHYARLLTTAGTYVMALSPFAMAAAWRTFVHATRWFETGAWGWIGVLEGGLCGFAGAFVMLLPSLLTHSPMQGVPYLLFYGGITFILGLGVGCVLWATATLTLKLFGLTPTFVVTGGDRSS